MARLCSWGNVLYKLSTDDKELKPLVTGQLSSRRSAMQVGAKSKSCGFPSDFLSKVSEHDKPLRAEDWTSGKKRLDRRGKAECCAMDKESRLIPKTVVVENVEIWCMWPPRATR